MKIYSTLKSWKPFYGANEFSRYREWTCKLWCLAILAFRLLSGFNRPHQHFTNLVANNVQCDIIKRHVGSFNKETHYCDVIMGGIASQITSLTIVYSTVYSDADKRKHQSSAVLAFVRGIHPGPGNSPHKWPVTRKLFPFGDVIMDCLAQ